MGIFWFVLEAFRFFWCWHSACAMAGTSHWAFAAGTAAGFAGVSLTQWLLVRAGHEGRLRYCGSHPGNKPVYAERAKALGTRLANDNLTLVYGGGNVGLMGLVADAALAAGGDVIGVIPEQLFGWGKVAHTGLTRLEVVANMHERKARMFDLSDAFVALPAASVRWMRCSRC